jgi:hypothetical protein
MHDTSQIDRMITMITDLDVFTAPLKSKCHEDLSSRQAFYPTSSYIFTVKLECYECGLEGKRLICLSRCLPLPDREVR